MDTTIKPKRKLPIGLNRKGLITAGIALIVIAVLVLALSAWEAFGRGAGVRMVEIPGFHELKLDMPGLYAGIYQHRGQGEMPLSALSHLDVRVMSKGLYTEVPVMVNTAGQTFNRMGLRGMPVFNFVIDEPGAYTLSAVYNDGYQGPTLPVFVIPQTAQNIKQTLIVGISFFVLFLVAGIFIFVRLNRWAPKNPTGN